MLVTALLLGSSGVILGVGALSNHLLSNRQEEEPCKEAPTEYTLTIEDGKLSADTIYLHRCDRLAIMNRDEQLRLIAFGVHDHHQSYNNITERTLLKGQQLAVTLTERGTYMFHDHLHDEVKGTFTVE